MPTVYSQARHETWALSALDANCIAIMDLAKIACLSPQWPEVLMGFVGAFDASGHESDQPILCVAGFVSSADHWIEFTDKWKARLAQEGLTYFQLKEFMQWKSPERAKEALLGDLIGIISSHAFRKFGVVVGVSGMTQHFSKADRKEFRLTAYSSGGLRCVIEVDKWASRESRGVPIEYIFEEGDKGRGELEDSLKRKGYPYSFRPGKKDRATKTQNPVPAFIPLQAADFLAGVYFREAARSFRKPLRQTLPDRVFSEFDRMPGVVKYFSFDKLGELRRLLETTKQFEKRLGGRN